MIWVHFILVPLEKKRMCPSTRCCTTNLCPDLNSLATCKSAGVSSKYSIQQFMIKSGAIEYQVCRGNPWYCLVSCFTWTLEREIVQSATTKTKNMYNLSILLHIGTGPKWGARSHLTMLSIQHGRQSVFIYSPPFSITYSPSSQQ